RLAAATARAVDLDRVWSIADAPEPAPAAANSARLYPDEPLAPRTAIAVARDLAFSFYYEDALDLLAAWGAEVIPFSPLWDDRVPTAARGVYLGGGFPELYAAQLAANSPMVASVRDVAARGLPIYGECGGLMYLGRSLVDLDGRTHPMAGIVPLDSAMQWRRAVLGYRTVTALRPSPLLPVGAEVTGHEFHYSVLGAPAPPERAAYRIAERGGGLEGYAVDNVLASYVHVHFAHDAAIARRFVERCVAVGARDDRGVGEAERDVSVPLRIQGLERRRTLGLEVGLERLADDLSLGRTRPPRSGAQALVQKVRDVQSGFSHRGSGYLC